MESGLSPEQQELADWIIAGYDRIAYEGISKILNRIRGIEDTPEEDETASSSVESIHLGSTDIT